MHTEGGDGDADWMVKGESNFSHDEDSEADAQTSQKRKRGVKTTFGYSNKVLDEFENSKTYKAIDCVYVQLEFTSVYINPCWLLISRAYDDNTIVCHRNINSRVSDDDPCLPTKKLKSSSSHEDLVGGENTVILCDALTLMKDKAELNQTIAAANLELARKRDKREEEEAQEHHELAKRQQRVEEEKLKNEQLGMALQMLGNADEMVCMAGKSLITKLTGQVWSSFIIATFCCLFYRIWPF